MSGGVRLLGAVLAGGEGRRFGAPKADVTLGGVSLVRRAVRALQPVVEDVVVVSSRAVVDAPVDVVPDAREGVGPLGGLQAALDLAAERGLDGVLVLACDLPLVEAPLLRRVARSLGDRTAAAPEREGGGVEPLCAVYRVALADVLRARPMSSDRSVHAFFRDVGGEAVPLAELDAVPEDFLNVNTPAHRARAESVLAARAGGGP